jgi:Holliday junction resolvasome RuvABC DNA-binding subunit
MYDFFRGQLVEVTDQSLVLEVGGVGYRLAVPRTLASRVSVWVVSCCCMSTC